MSSSESVMPRVDLGRGEVRGHHAVESLPRQRALCIEFVGLSPNTSAVSARTRAVRSPPAATLGERPVTTGSM